ncbi:MAG TPA: malic enzyme-like NAD(P)-binding protein, partial [Saprospiraceae bacterium]|nr:malic enzyme-like NAD(P)-binding protein [Saprospiraceae bacterium]
AFIKVVKALEPTFGGINLEDIKGPECFYIEEKLKEIMNIPVFHDDQHGTAIVVIAGLINACKVVKKKLEDLTVVVNGAGAAGVAIAKMLKCIGFSEDECTPVKELIMCDSTGIIHRDRKDLNKSKLELLTFSNSANRSGSVKDAIVGADVFIGVSVANLLTARDIKKMNKDAIIFALANPVPEIMPEEAYKGGAAVVGTGRSDLPNQVNNVLGFPGVFRGALDAKAKVISPSMKLAAAYAIAKCVKNPSRECVIPPCLDLNVAKEVAKAVKKAALKDVDTYW